MLKGSAHRCELVLTVVAHALRVVPGLDAPGGVGQGVHRPEDVLELEVSGEHGEQDDGHDGGGADDEYRQEDGLGLGPLPAEELGHVGLTHGQNVVGTGAYAHHQGAPHPYRGRLTGGPGVARRELAEQVRLDGGQGGVDLPAVQGDVESVVQTLELPVQVLPRGGISCPVLQDGLDLLGAAVHHRRPLHVVVAHPPDHQSADQQQTDEGDGDHHGVIKKDTAFHRNTSSQVPARGPFYFTPYGETRGGGKSKLFLKQCLLNKADQPCKPLLSRLVALFLTH